MSFRPAHSIRAKLALLIAASVGAAVLLAFGVSSYRELSRFGEAKRSELQATAEILATSVAESVARGDRAAALQALNAIGRVPGIRFAEIRDADGGTVAEAGAGVALTSDRGTVEGETATVWQMLTEGSFFVTADIVKAGRTLGTIGMLVDTTELADRLRRALLAALLSAGVAILTGLLIAARLQRSITGPLGELTETMNRVRVTSDFRQHVLKRTDDETGQLVDAFNDMLEQIRRRDKALDDHRTGLERTVEERTRDLALARDAAESANRAKSEFLATMSHEIRTPMNGMLVMAELLAGTELPARQQRYAETIARSGQTLLAIINDILDLSKIEAGKLELEQGRVQIATIADDIIVLFSEKALSRNLDLAALIGGGVPVTIEADPTRLSQVLSNLVNNALKFTETGHVKVSVKRQGEIEAGEAELVFAVEDTGIGVPAEKVDSIFEAFSQADQSTTRRYGGTGLGLSICRRLVNAWGGRIWAESEPGKGSKFAFSIRARVLEPAIEIEQKKSGTALVAVDGAATRSVLAATLRDFGYSFRTGVANSTAQKADVIFAGAEWLEARPPRSHVAGDPHVVCIAGVGGGKVDRLLSSGLADAVLMQPVSSGRVGEILQAIEAGTLASLLDTRRATPAVDMPDLSGLAVLVADDSPVNREVVTEALARLQAETRTVEDGARAVEAFKHGRFGIVLMDCSMPEMDGFAATREIRAFEAAEGRSRTPIVALTAHVAGEGADSWRDAGMDDYLTKPFTIRSLADCLARWRRAEAPGTEIRAMPIEAIAPETAPEAAHIDGALDPAALDSLRTITGGSDIMLGKIFGLFRAHAPARLEALKVATAARDYGRMASEAHALKSPSINIGALRLGGLCADFETRARSGDDALFRDESLQRIASEFAAVLDAIEGERSSEDSIASTISVPATVA